MRKRLPALLPVQIFCIQHLICGARQGVKKSAARSGLQRFAAAEHTPPRLMGSKTPPTQGGEVQGREVPLGQASITPASQISSSPSAFPPSAEATAGERRFARVTLGPRQMERTCCERFARAGPDSCNTPPGSTAGSSSTRKVPGLEELAHNRAGCPGGPLAVTKPAAGQGAN